MQKKRLGRVSGFAGVGLYMSNVDSTHCTPLPPDYFVVPTSTITDQILIDVIEYVSQCIYQQLRFFKTMVDTLTHHLAIIPILSHAPFSCALPTLPRPSVSSSLLDLPFNYYYSYIHPEQDVKPPSLLPAALMDDRWPLPLMQQCYLDPPAIPPAVTCTCHCGSTQQHVGFQSAQPDPKIVKKYNFMIGPVEMMRVKHAQVLECFGSEQLLCTSIGTTN